MISSSTLFSVSLLLLVHDVIGAKSGIIGYGLSMYEDLCCLSCHDSLSSLYLDCTTFTDMPGMDMAMGKTSAECRTSNKPWLESMAYCIQQACSADGYSVEEQARCFNVHAVDGALGHSFHHSLPHMAPTVELPHHAMWLNATSLVNHDLYHSAHGTMGEFARSEYIHSKYA